MTEPKYQLSDKVTDTAILVVRGDDYNDFTNQLHAVAEDETFHVDIMKAITSITGKKITLEQAQANVEAAFGPGQQPQQVSPQQWQQAPPPWDQQAAPQQQTWGAPQQGFPVQQVPQSMQSIYTCPHGQRQHRDGRTKAGGTWEGWFCPVKAEGCKTVDSNGKPWK